MDNDLARRQIRRARIQHITQEIDILSAELNQLVIQDNQENNTEQLPPVDPTNQQEQLAIGSRVEITNSYKGQRGLQGTVTKITEKQVSLRIDGQRRIINKKKTNVRVLDNV
jgi:hypothetical protein